DELAALAMKIDQAGQTALAIEMELFDSLVAETASMAGALARIADALAVLDAASALAELAEARGFIRPIVDTSLAFQITRGRHPVVERALVDDNRGPFTANAC